MSQDLPENSIVAILGRMEKHLEKLDRAITGGEDPRGGLAFKVAKIEDQIDTTLPDRVQVLESDAKNREIAAARRDNIVTGLIVAVGAALILAVAPLIFRTLSSLPIGG